MKRVLSYFRTSCEALHLAVEVAPHSWAAIAGNRPVLRRDDADGSSRIRDPFLVRGPDGNFHLLATGGNGPADMLHASSSDLLQWTELKTVPVMAGVEGVRNVWAPEAFFDRTADAWRVIWSSTVGVEKGHAGWNHRIWSCTTNDFVHFGPPAVWFDPEHNVIDATVYTAPDADYLVFKDERGRNADDTEYKWLCSAVRSAGQECFGSLRVKISPHLVEAPILFRDNDCWTLYYDCFLHECWGGLSSRDFEHWERIAKIELPPSVRHGSVIEVEDDLAQRLLDIDG